MSFSTKSKLNNDEQNNAQFNARRVEVSEAVLAMKKKKHEIVKLMKLQGAEGLE